jgi:hypothetical protein
MRLLPPIIHLPSAGDQAKLVVGLYDLGISYDASPSAARSWDAFNRDTQSGETGGKTYPWITLLESGYLTAFRNADDPHCPCALMNSVNHFLWYAKQFNAQPMEQDQYDEWAAGEAAEDPEGN